MSNKIKGQEKLKNSNIFFNISLDKALLRRYSSCINSEEVLINGRTNNDS